MTTIDFSIILDTVSDCETIVGLMSAFKHETGIELGTVTRDIMNDPSIDSDEAVTKAMDSLAGRLNLTLE